MKNNVTMKNNIVRNNNWMADFFNGILDDSRMVRTNAAMPAVNVTENEHAYELELAAPGTTRDNFSLTLDADGDLVIKMEEKTGTREESADKGRLLRREWSCTRFQRTMILPEDADREKIGAKVENGVLSVSIPKVEKTPEEESVRMIEIR